MKKKLIISLFLLVIMPIFILRYFGFLQKAELTAYDLMFHLRHSEPTDERIVLVVWDERDIQIQEESIASDKSLGFILDKIKAQQPRIIGLDLYRDIPEESIHLSEQENDEAYQHLQEIFRSTTNLIGIEKVLPPKIDPSQVLLQEGRVASSDLIEDSDNFIRRSFIDPMPQAKEGTIPKVRKVPYLGIVLGYQYLAKEGFIAQETKRSSLKLSQGNRNITLEQLKNFDGAYVNDQIGYDVLINWRKSEVPFVKVNFNQIFADSIPKDIFHDKIVIIGNAASSTSDRHNIPLNRWTNQQPSWTYGLEIPAHIASSIVSAALDNRALIRVVPGGLGYWLALFSAVAISVFALKYRDLKIIPLYAITILGSLVLVVFIFLIAYWSFLNGVWIPIVPSIFTLIGSLFVSNSYIQSEKERKNMVLLGLLTRYLDHRLGNSFNLIDLETKVIKREAKKLHKFSFQEYEEQQEIGIISSRDSFVETDEGKSLQELQLSARAISQQISLALQSRKRATQFLDTFSNKKNQLIFENINHLIQYQVAKQIKSNSSLKIIIIEDYDPTIGKEKINPFSLEMILENLLDNAIRAVASKQTQKQPTIHIKTYKRRNSIEICISDNGIGIPSQALQQIFEMFVSLREGGQGIGLALVKKLVHLEGGTITVESEVGKGSDFTFVLPRRKIWRC